MFKSLSFSPAYLNIYSSHRSLSKSKKKEKEEEEKRESRRRKREGREKPREYILKLLGTLECSKSHWFINTFIRTMK